MIYVIEAVAATRYAVCIDRENNKNLEVPMKKNWFAKVCAAACLTMAMFQAPGSAEAAPGWCANVHSGSPAAEWAICDNPTLGNLDGALN